MQIIVQKHLVSYWQKGSGPVFLILPGWGATKEGWIPLAEKLAQKYQVIVLDLPGFGGSDYPGVWSVSDYQKFVTSFLIKKSIKEIILLGHSFGGQIAIELASKNHSLVKKLILVNSARIVRKKTFIKKTIWLLTKLFKFIFSWPLLNKFRFFFQKQWYRLLGQSDYLVAGKMQATYAVVVEEDSQVAAAKISQPTLLLWGNQDKDTPLEDAYLFKKIIPKAGLDVLPEAGHFSFLDQPDLFWESLIKFLGQK